jgi:hypothetical protein
VAYRDPTEVIIAIDPQVVAKETQILDGAWQASGHVEIQFKRGPQEGFAKLEFPFKNASSPADAMQQAAPMLEQIATELNRLLSVLREKK